MHGISLIVACHNKRQHTIWQYTTHTEETGKYKVHYGVGMAKEKAVIIWYEEAQYIANWSQVPVPPNGVKAREPIVMANGSGLPPVAPFSRK